MKTRPTNPSRILHTCDRRLLPVVLAFLAISLGGPILPLRVHAAASVLRPLSAHGDQSSETLETACMTNGYRFQTPTPAPTPTYRISPDKIQSGKTRDVTITTDTDDLTNAELQEPATGSGVTFEPVAGRQVQHPDSKTIVVRVAVDEDADLGAFPITLIRQGAAFALVNLEIAEFKPRRITRGPTPDDIAEVDATWNVVPYKIVKAAFGRRAADSFYAIEVTLGNNSGFDLQIVAVGFDSTLGAPSALDKNGKPLQPIYDAQGKPILDDRGNRLIADLDEHGDQKMIDGKPAYKPYKSYMLPTSDHRLVRSSIEMDQLYGKRASALNLIGGVGTLVSGFIPFFHAANAKANYSSFSSVLNGQFKEGFGIAAPDLTVSQLNRLENLVLHEGLTVPNNDIRKTIVFFPRHVVSLSDDDRKIIDRGNGMWPLIEKLGDLIIVGKPMIRFRNREIVATKPQPANTPSPAVPPALAPPNITTVAPNEGNAAGKTVVISGANFTNGASVTFGGVASSKVTFLTPTQMNAEIPPEALSGKIKVTTPGGTADSPNDFFAQPRVTAVEPKNATPGSPVTIKGANLARVSSVNFGSVSVPQASFTIREKDRIVVVVPVAAESGLVVLNTPADGNATAPVTEKFIAEPVLDSLGTKKGKTDDRVIISGKNLDNAEVKFGNVTAEVINPGSTSIEIKVPANAVSGPLTIKTPGGVKRTEDFTFIPKPIITGMSVDNGIVAESASGKAGATVTITGLNFKDAKVFVGDQEVSPSKKNDTQITFLVPANTSAGSTTVKISTPGGDASTDKLTVIQ
jgi:hypothetical protein